MFYLIWARGFRSCWPPVILFNLENCQLILFIVELKIFCLLQVGKELGVVEVEDLLGPVLMNCCMSAVVWTSLIGWAGTGIFVCYRTCLTLEIEEKWSNDVLSHQQIETVSAEIPWLPASSGLLCSRWQSFSDRPEQRERERIVCVERSSWKGSNWKAKKISSSRPASQHTHLALVSFSILWRLLLLRLIFFCVVLPYILTSWPIRFSFRIIFLD